ncbi:hypothetical protein ABZ499_32195 [Streptomyces sp. NPDC019990]
MTNQNHRLALVPGDGLRAEVLPPTRRFGEGARPLPRRHRLVPEDESF